MGWTMCEERTMPGVDSAGAVWRLIKVPKYAEDDRVELSDHFSRSVNLNSQYGKRTFILDVTKRRLELKYTMQTRYGTATPLIRLDVNTSHINPAADYHVGDDDPFSGIHDSCIGRKFDHEPHLHVYRPGFGDRWAYPVAGVFDNTRNMGDTLLDFLGYCNIQGVAEMQEALFDYSRRGQEPGGLVLCLAQERHRRARCRPRDGGHNHAHAGPP